MAPTVAQALAAALAVGSGEVSRLDAQRLLADCLGRSRAWLFAHADAPLSAEQATVWASQLARLADAVPLAYLLGEHEFHGLRLSITPAVLVPRADTETLVDWALALLPGVATPALVDLGTGSGAIALALARAWPAAAITATDLSPAALALARHNADALGLSLQWRLGHWWQALASDGGPAGAFDIAVSNPPYIATADPHLPGLRHEPALALTSGGDGLSAIRQIVAGAPQHLRCGAWLLLEHGFDQREQVCSLLRQAGFADVQSRRDLAGQWRCSGGRWPGPSSGGAPGG